MLNKGKITVYIGCMFSGKTSSLIRDIDRHLRAKRKCVILKPSIDTRFGEANVVSHNNVTIAAHSFKNLAAADEWIKEEKPDVIGIDEGSLFEDIDIYPHRWANAGLSVIVTGLDGDYLQNPFGNNCQFLRLIAQAEHVHKLSSVCPYCGDDAYFTFRKGNDAGQVVIGGADKYDPICRKCLNQIKNNFENNM